MDVFPYNVPRIWYNLLAIRQVITALSYELILCDCVNDDDENIYILYGRAYDKLEKPDSSTWAFKKGLKINPDSEKLLDWAALSSSREVRNGNTKKLDEQLYFLERLLEINPGDVSALEKISDAYRRSEMYEEQIDVLNMGVFNQRKELELMVPHDNSYSGKATFGTDLKEVNRYMNNTPVQDNYKTINIQCDTLDNILEQRL